MNSNAETKLKVAEEAACSVCTDAGVYYAQVPVPGQKDPVRVALHGVTTASQAAEALKSFTRLCLAATL
jgi:hypothetical protein